MNDNHIRILLAATFVGITAVGIVVGLQQYHARTELQRAIAFSNCKVRGEKIDDRLRGEVVKLFAASEIFDLIVDTRSPTPLVACDLIAPALTHKLEQLRDDETERRRQATA